MNNKQSFGATCDNTGNSNQATKQAGVLEHVGTTGKPPLLSLLRRCTTAGLRIMEHENKSATQLEVRQEDFGYVDDQNLVDTWQSWSRVVDQLVDYVGYNVLRILTAW